MVELKCGKPAPTEWLQLATYCLWLESTGRGPTGGVYLGRVVYLRGGVERWVVVTADDLARARATILDGLAAERDAVFSDPERGVVRPPREVPLAANTARCPGCDLWLLCRDELTARAPETPGAPPGAPLDTARLGSAAQDPPHARGA